MWSCGEDFNDEGLQVRLYQPILYAGRKPESNSLTTSFVGGTSNHDMPTRTCSSCSHPLHLITQLYAPQTPSSKHGGEHNDRTFQVFACNRSSCIRSLFTINIDSSNKLCFGGKGVITCVKIDSAASNAQNLNLSKEKSPAISISDWEVTAKNKKTDNDWDVDATGDMDDLANKLAELESGLTKTKQQSVERKNPKLRKENDSQSSNGVFPCYELHSLHEPPVIRQKDADDVGISGSDEKIRRLLEKYMAEEDDEDILHALRSSKNGGGSGGAGRGGEKDERLSPEDRALFTFTDRLKRYPKQVLRYAYDGSPLWSIPLITPSEAEQRAKRSQRVANSNQNTKRRFYGVERSIPVCEKCGSSRVFEFQILPSILHVLKVDKTADTSNGLRSVYQDGSMDWGNIAVYTCSSGCTLVEELCVIQDSVDELPTAEQFVSSGNTRFVDDEDDMDDDDDEENINGETRDIRLDGMTYECDDDDEW